ncbi:Tim44-like domain-containing protein [Pseudoalteromonas sp. BDTF-M6]|uniref:Tim44 domain-containing protein n=1 Tax=Pseudoalteromonas sp. BDTF-M6 TaxID=2796132 RepID=UPI001BAE6DD8|nr:Tim44-like domain-containing protein [Pseudoalteromonas sp. BDTF-M6]MBS3796454.1 Tim44 domain-containing protein [Pseudoalteromonas sp. BDTF-M6]
MKNLVIMLTLLSVLFTASFDAQARKKFGSKRTTGKTEQTQTTQKQQTTDTNTVTAKKNSSKKGIMAGVLGGLLAGGLIAAMMGDDFEGVQLLEILLLAGLGFLLFKFIRSAMRKNQPRPMMATAQGQAYAGQGQWQQSSASAQSRPQPSSVPMQLPPNFDQVGFIRAAKEHYVTIQQAWNDNNLDLVSEYLAPELIDEFKALRAEQGEVLTEVLFVDANIVRASCDNNVWAISIHFSGQYQDRIAHAKERIDEIWHMERQNADSAPWLIVGTEDLVD